MACLIARIISLAVLVDPTIDSAKRHNGNNKMKEIFLTDIDDAACLIELESDEQERCGEIKEGT